ncbi:MAG: NUDIX hydrolase [Gemmatimonadota bacterium]
MTDSPRLASTRVYSGRILDLDVDRVRFPDGSVGELEMVRHPGAAAVVPFASDPAGEDPQLLLIRQYRYAAERAIYEIPAGRLDPGETPLDCAIRELLEETGCTAERVEPLIAIYTTPGITDEKIHLFMATGLTMGESQLEADEFIEVVTFPLSEVLQMIERGEIVDGKTLVAILFAAGYRLGR